MVAAAIQLLHERLTVVLPVEVRTDFGRIAVAGGRSFVTQYHAPRTATAVIQRCIHLLLM
jgi:hypothetical protein